MKPSHLSTLLAFSVLVSAVFAMLSRDDGPARLRFGLSICAAFVLSAIVIGWLMHAFPS